MALVVFLRGLNVGGHRRLRPKELASALQHLDVVNVGAAGTLVVRRPIRPAELRREIARRLPFEAELAICAGRDVLRLVSSAPFEGVRVRPDVVRFVSVLVRPARAAPPLPLRLPAVGPWLVTVRARDGRFVLGVHRRQMKAIGYLGRLDRLFGAPATTRGWSTVAAVARVLAD